MSFNSFMKAMLSEDMLELGFRHYKGSEWYKLIDDSVYLNVSATKLSFGGIELSFHICSLFAEHLRDLSFVYSYDAAHLMNQHILSKGGDLGNFGFRLFYRDENTDEGREMIRLGREAFALAKPVLASVHDLQSCFEAKQRAGYLSWFMSGSKWLGRDYTPQDHAESEPDDAYSILCSLGRYEEAAEYLRRYIENFKSAQYRGLEEPASANENADPKLTAFRMAQVDELVKEQNEYWAPYIEAAESRDVEKINADLLRRYNENCDLLEEKHRIKIDRSKIVLGR